MSACREASYAVTGAEGRFAELLAELIGREQVPVDSHFFDDLGANSLVMAHFCARVRKCDDLPSVSMKDIYRYPTVRELAGSVAQAEPSPSIPPVPAPVEARKPASTLEYVVCGAVQSLLFLAYSYGALVLAMVGAEWISSGSGLADTYLRSVVAGAAGFVVLCLFPVAAKWLLVGRWKPGDFPVWGLTYLRFWIVKALLHASPILLFVGNPLYVVYLRALGARIGKGVTILSRTVPVCTDLLTIGDGSVIRKESLFLCYRAHAGRIETGRVVLGREVFIGEKTVLDINTSMGDRAQLGHTSALYSGGAVPVGERWHGSPAEPTELDYISVAPARCGTLRRAVFGLVSLLQLLFVYIPLAVGGVYLLTVAVPSLGELLGAGLEGSAAIATSTLYVDAMVLSTVLFFGSALAGIAIVFTIPRLLNLLIEPDKVYPLYGLHYAVHRAIGRMTNNGFYLWLVGDSSYVVHYLQGLGYDLSRVQQTGSNFGMDVKQDTPYLSSVGSGTMVADGLSIINADYSSTSFRVSRASIGPRNFLGNFIAYPARGRTGDNCLLATKVMVPLDGDIREGVGLLGSPCFEIPRSVERDTRFDHLRTGDELWRHLAAKNRYNLRTMCLFLFLRWLHVLLVAFVSLTALASQGAARQLMLAALLVFSLVLSTSYFVLVERCITRFRALQPQLCSIYDPYFWWHERLWKVPHTYLNLFNGTPFKSLVARLLGARMGRRVFDDGCYYSEPTLTTIGDDCTLNPASLVQCHSQEDGTFKSDRSAIGLGCTLGVGAMVHYGVTVGDRAVLAPDSFLMKGEQVPPDARWGGNPATEIREPQDQLNGAHPTTVTSTGTGIRRRMVSR